MQCNTIHFSSHAITRMFERGLNPEAIENIINSGEIVADYPQDEPYPSSLLLGWNQQTPVHVVVARNEKDYSCYVVTAYVPSSELWSDDYKSRKQS